MFHLKKKLKNQLIAIHSYFALAAFADRLATWPIVQLAIVDPATIFGRPAPPCPSNLAAPRQPAQVEAHYNKPLTANS